MLTPIKFEYTRSCSDDYLVEKKDFMVFVFEATGNNSAYPFHHAFFGPQIQYTSTRNHVFSVSFIGFIHKRTMYV